MKNHKFTFTFKNGEITVRALNYKIAKFLAEAEAIKRGWEDHTVKEESV